MNGVYGWNWDIPEFCFFKLLAAPIWVEVLLWCWRSFYIASFIQDTTSKINFIMIIKITANAIAL